MGKRRRLRNRRGRPFPKRRFKSTEDNNRLENIAETSNPELSKNVAESWSQTSNDFAESSHQTTSNDRYDSPSRTTFNNWTEFYVDLDTLTNNDYCEALSNYGFHEEIFITNIPSETLKLEIKFVKRKTLTLNSENVVDHLKAFNFLKIDEIMQKIGLILPDLICEENCIQLYNTALTLEHLYVFMVINLYMQIYFQSIVENDNVDIGDLPLKLLEYLLSDNMLNIKNEDKVWDAIVKWVETDQESRLEAVPILLRCIRLDQCEESFIQTLLKHPLMDNNEHCDVIIVKSKLLPRKNATLHTRFVESIRELSPEPLVFGPRQPRRLQCIVSYHQISYHMWGLTHFSISPAAKNNKRILFLLQKESFIPKFVFSSCLKIYVIDCFGNHFAFDLMKKSLTDFESPPKNDEVSFNLLNGRIFASIIRCSHSTYASIAVYDSQINEWETLNWFCLTPLKTRVICFEAAALEGVIYIAATVSVNASRFKTMARAYNVEKNVWSPFELQCDHVSNQDLMHFFTMVAYDGSLYFIRSEEKSLFRFDPQEHVWKSFQELPHVFTHPRAVVYDGTLVVFNKPIRTDPIPPVHWDKNLKQWRSCSWRHHTMSFEIDEAEVLWNYRKGFI